MESFGDLFMRKQLRTCRRRQSPKVKLKSDDHSCGKLLLDNKSCSIVRSGSSKEVYFVQTILSERVIKGQKYYKVRWQGFSPEADSWEPEENLSNVQDIIANFHSKTKSASSKNEEFHNGDQVFENSPASISTPPVTPGSNSSSVDYSRAASEERQVNIYFKRKLYPKSRIGGRYEYVPKHELVASKTKYFDDIRDGKIDLSSNDLYSRVKTRKRCAVETASNSTSNESTNSRNGSLHEEIEQDYDNSMESFTQYFSKRESSSLSFGCFDASDSLGDFNCTSDVMELDNSRILVNSNVDHISIDDTKSFMDSKTALFYTSNDTNMNSNTTETISTLAIVESKLTQTDVSKLELMSWGVSSYASSTKDVALSPISNLEQCDQTNLNDSCTLSEDCDSLNAPNLKPTVSSIRQLVIFYFKLVSSYWSKINETLNDSDKLLSTNQTMTNQCQLDYLVTLPQLCPFNPHIKIKTNQDFLDAIHNQRWSLIASSNIFPLSSSSSSSLLPNDSVVKLSTKSINFVPNETILVSCIRAGNPLMILHQFINSGLDLNNVVDSNTQLPILILAVRLSRHHAAQALLDSGVRPDCIEPGPRRRTALGLAIATGDMDMVNILILSGANFYEVEPGVTALNFIIRLLNAHLSARTFCNSKTPHSKETYNSQLSTVNHMSPPITKDPVQSNHNSKSFSIAMAEFQDKLRSPDSQYPPIPCPCPQSLDGGTRFQTPHRLPKAVVYNALMNNYNYFNTITTCTGTSTNTIINNNNCNSIQSKGDHHSDSHNVGPHEEEMIHSKGQALNISLPSVDSLRRIYDLVAAHHARLSMNVSKLVRNWLSKANLTKIGLISPCQWINVNKCQTDIKFYWPFQMTKWKSQSPPNNKQQRQQQQCDDGTGNNTSLVLPILILVHGNLIPPACYDLWLDDDGPCLIKQVCLDGVYIQKPLNCMPFVTTLHPLDTYNSKPKEHHVSIDFVNIRDGKSNNFPLGLRPTCVAAMIIAVKLNNKLPMENIVNNNLNQIPTTATASTSDTTIGIHGVKNFKHKRLST